MTLPISRLISVKVNLSPAAAQAQSLNSLLILSANDTIDVVTRMRSYTTLAEVEADPTMTATEIAAATDWFAQVPQPTQLYIGRWAKTASHGQLFGGALTPTQQALSNFTSITNGGVDFLVDGSAKNLTGLNFSSAASLNAVASIITTAFSGSATCVWDALDSRFEVTSASTGASSSVGFATAGSGTDISSLLGLTQATSGSYEAAGIVAETAVAAVELFDSMFGQQWYAIIVIGAVDSDYLAIAPVIEASNNKHYFGVTTQEAAVLIPGDTSDIAYELSQIAGLNHTCVQYSSTDPYAVVSLLARILTTDWQGNNTAIDLMYKQEPGITPENLNSTQIGALEAKNCNAFVSYNNNTAIIEPGNSSSGLPIDTVMGTDAMAVDVQTALYNVLYLSPTKIPQTDAGTHVLTTAINAVLAQYVTNGLLAPGQWNSQGFGSLNDGDWMSTGYYTYAPPVATQDAADRGKRISVPIQSAAKLAGAVRDVDLSILVNS